MIHCADVVKRYGNVLALAHVSFDLGFGVFALLGPNGAGKSTLLRVLTGLLPPDSGVVSIDGLDPRRDGLKVKQSIGVVPEGLGLIEELTIDEHLAISAVMYRLSRDEAAERADDLLRALGLDDARTKFVHQCSYGMRKKLALAMALLHNPRGLFLDEPFEGVDPASSQTIQLILTAAGRRRMTVLLTSHVLSTIEEITPQFLMIRNGAIVWNSLQQPQQAQVQTQYFQLMEPPIVEDLTWLGH